MKGFDNIQQPLTELIEDKKIREKKIFSYKKRRA